jgi:hypothetical protein
MNGMTLLVLIYESVIINQMMLYLSTQWTSLHHFIIINSLSKNDSLAKNIYQSSSESDSFSGSLSNSDSPMAMLRSLSESIRVIFLFRKIQSRWPFATKFKMATRKQRMFILSLFRQHLKKASYVWYHVLFILLIFQNKWYFAWIPIGT